MFQSSLPSEIGHIGWHSIVLNMLDVKLGLREVKTVPPSGIVIHKEWNMKTRFSSV